MSVIHFCSYSAFFSSVLKSILSVIQAFISCMYVYNHKHLVPFLMKVDRTGGNLCLPVKTPLCMHGSWSIMVGVVASHIKWANISIHHCPFNACSGLSFGSDLTGLATPPNEMAVKPLKYDMFTPDPVEMAVSPCSMY